MKILKRIRFLALVLAPVCLMGMESKRETVFDHVEHVELELKEVPQIAPLCASISGLTQKRIKLRDGAELYCELEGRQGIPIVLLAGGPGNSHHAFHPYFSKLADFAQVIYFDFRGCGKSDYVKGAGYSIDQAVDDLDDLRKSLGIEKWVVLGHSNGGFIAQYYTKKYAPHVLGLVLVDADFDVKIQEKQLNDDYSDQRIHNSEREKQRLSEIRVEAFKLLSSETEYIAHPEKLQKYIYNMLLNGDWKRQSFYLPTNDEMIRKSLYEFTCDWGYADSMCKTQRDVDISTFDGSIPTLIIEGKFDLTWNPNKKPAILHSIHPHAKLIMFDRSAHSPFADEPEKFLDSLKAFITDIPSSTNLIF